MTSSAPAAALPLAPIKFASPSQSQVPAVFGNVGEHLTRLVFPYPMLYDGKPVASCSCHEKVRDAALRVFERVRDHYGLDAIHTLKLDDYGGCFNPRKMTGSSTRWSMHAWGIAWDFNPSDNEFRENHKTARFARPEYAFWFQAWNEAGAVSLGQKCDYDWMHVQFATI